MTFFNELMYRDDEEPQDGLLHYERAISRCCEIRESPRHALTEQTISFDRYHTSASVRLLFPRNTGRYEWDDYFTEGYSKFDIMREERLAPMLESYEQRMMKGAAPREGSMEFINHREMRIRPGNRRYPSITHQQAAEGIFYHQHTSPSPWHWHEPFPTFYSELVAPHLPKDGRKDPFGWALERLKIAHGYGMEFFGGDYAPDYAEHPYKEMAARACNLLPDCLRLPRKYTLDDKKQALLEKVKTLCALPDAACIALENADTIDAAMLDDPTVKLFFTELPRMLENGFVLDRFTETVRAQRASGLDALEAVRFAAQLVCSMYRGELIPLKPEEGGPFFDKKPWWFKENVDLAGMQDDEERTRERTTKGECAIPFDDTGRALLLKIGEAGSFATEYLLETYRTVGHRLAAMEGVGEDTAVDLCSEVVWEYGIGNPARAIRVLEHAVSLAQETPPEQRAQALEELFLTHVLRERSGPPLIVAMEGDDACIDFPGLLPLLHSLLGKDRMQKDELWQKNIGADHIRDATSLLAAIPLRKRACAQIAFAPDTQYEQRRLLPRANRTAPQLQLSPPERQRLLAGTTTGPLAGLLGLYKQLRDECGENDGEHAAILYFSICAARMRDPFHPPQGLLGLLQKYHSIPVVTLKDMNEDLFRHPGDQRRRRSSERRCDQAMTLSHLMDAVVMGAITEEELVETLRWLCVEATTEQEIECSWNVHEDNGWRTGGKMYSIDSEGKEVEHIENKDEDAELNWRTRNAISEVTGQDRAKRLEALAGTLDNGVLLTQLMEYGALRKPETLAALRSVILRWKEGKMPPGVDIEREPDSWRDKEVIDGLRACLEAGILNKEVLARDCLQAMKAGMRITDLLASIPGTSEALHRTQGRVEQFSSHLSYLTQTGPREDRMALVRQELDWLRTELKREYWGGDLPPLYTLPDAVDRIIAVTRVPAVMQIESAMRIVSQELLSENPPALPSPEGGTSAASSDEEPAYEETQRVPAELRDILSATRGSLKTLPLLSLPVRNAIEPPRTRRFARVRQKEIQTGEHLFEPSPEVLKVVRRYRQILSEQGPEMREQIRNWRMAGRGLLPVGGKVHVSQAFREEDMTLLRAFVGEGQYDGASGFHLIHAARALLLPPRPSVEEWEAAIALLIRQRAIRDHHPQLQIGLPGRIVPEHCGHLAVSALLATPWSARFTEDAFRSTHDHATGARMIAYDAGAPNAALPFMMRRGGANLEGRTDVLGRRHPEDARVVQLVGTVLMDQQIGGPFAALGEEYVKRLGAILDHYGIANVLDAPWVFRNEREKYDKDDAASHAHFHQGVQPCQDLYFACAEAYRERTKTMGPDAPREGIIFDIRGNVDWLRREVENHQPTAIDADPRFKDHLRYLLHV